MIKHLKGRQALPLVKRLNEVSFGIYLTHPMFFNLMDVFHAAEQLPTAAYILTLTLVGLAGSIGWNILVNRWRWGGLVFGKRMQIA
jgi:peptidoglycan/LPS O-acetylase OafA/YrhL